MEVLAKSRSYLEGVGKRGDFAVLGNIQEYGNSVGEDTKEWDKLRRIFYPTEQLV